MLHPVIQSWFQERFGEATEVQERAWPVIDAGLDVVMAAPTGSGKTLAGFLAILNRLYIEGLEGRLNDGMQIIYVSPLKALVNDIHVNLTEPLQQIDHLFTAKGFVAPKIQIALRTGDTPAKTREKTLRHPPHILVTTPESLYLLVSSKRGRNMLSNVKTVIVDEVHALAPNRRGAHLSLTLARLQQLIAKPFQRIAISATQRPLETVADFTGCRPDRVIIDCGHYRHLEIEIEVPKSPLSAVMSLEVWDEVYERLNELVDQHQSTLIFVNTRRLAERVAHHLQRRIGEEMVASHHGSLSVERRHDAEFRLKQGTLKALVATASLELGIDIGAVDLVCQIGAPRRVSTLLQRIGRSGHRRSAIPKGALFPLTRDELIECAASVASIRAGDLESLEVPKGTVDVLSQQLVAEVSNQDWQDEDLFLLVKKSYPYRNLAMSEFQAVLDMLSQGFATSRGRRSAWLFHDKRDGGVRARKGARITALTSGGAIADNADYRVVLEPQGTFIGTLNEDFAIESMAGDIFALGTSSWRILRVTQGTVRVQDAHGQAPTIPFWLGEAPTRSGLLSEAVAALIGHGHGEEVEVTARLKDQYRLSDAAATQLAQYLVSAKDILGCLPSRTCVVIERFFDASGGMQLVIHSPFGAAINRAWGLALRKRFCRSFNFELQAAAIEDAIVISLSQVHAFPLEDIAHFLSPESARDVLVQALLDAPMFQTRWRWNASIALAIPRRMGGKETPPFIRRMQAEDLIAAVFPDQLACLENIAGDREIPDHPLVQQTIDDCLHEAMDVDGFIELLRGIKNGAIRLHTIDLPAPSPLADEVLNAKPYAFLDDAPLEERRTRAVRRQPDDLTRRKLFVDDEALNKLRQMIWPTMDSEDDAYDGLYLAGFISSDEVDRLDAESKSWIGKLIENGRALKLEDPLLIMAWERLPQWQQIQNSSPDLPLLAEFVLPILETRGPLSVDGLASYLNQDAAMILQCLNFLEASGRVFRGQFDPTCDQTTWCERLVLDRLHRLTVHVRRQRVSPIEAEAFVRFLFDWQFLSADTRLYGADSLGQALHRLEGFSAAAASWENELLPARLKGYQPAWLDSMGHAGRIAWLRSDSSAELSLQRRFMASTPICLIPREELSFWATSNDESLEGEVGEIFRYLSEQDLFMDELVRRCNLPETRVEQALSALASQGLIRSDAFAGVRALLRSEPEKRKLDRHRRLSWFPVGASAGGRWSKVITHEVTTEIRAEHVAMNLLNRYGIVFRKLLDYQTGMPPWRDLLRAYWRLEAIGEIQSGHFVAGYSGQQFALPQAMRQSKKISQSGSTADLMIHACDPCNLTGIVAGAPRVAARVGARILYRGGVANAAWSQNKLELLTSQAENERDATERQFARRPQV